MEKQKVKGKVISNDVENGCCFILIGNQEQNQRATYSWWPYLLPVGAEVEVTVKVK